MVVNHWLVRHDVGSRSNNSLRKSVGPIETEMPPLAFAGLQLFSARQSFCFFLMFMLVSVSLPTIHQRKQLSDILTSLKRMYFFTVSLLICASFYSSWLYFYIGSRVFFQSSILFPFFLYMCVYISLSFPFFLSISRSLSLLFFLQLAMLSFVTFTMETSKFTDAIN